jgi:sulfofructose kinase
MPDSFPEVLAAGINAVDFLARPPAGVVPGGKYETYELDVQGGGPAATAACVAAAFGHDCAFIARLGDDPVSLLSRAQFAEAGIRPDFLIRSPGERAAMSMVQIDRATGERTIYYNLRNYGWLQPGDIPAEAVRQAKLVFVDGYDPAAALDLLRAARGSGCRSVIDVLLPLHTARAAAGKETPEDCLHALAMLGTGQMVVTDGERGSWALMPEGIFHQPAFSVDVVDTNGCGDAFHGGYGVGLLRGWPLALRLEFAAWTAARVATALGGRRGIPNLDTARAERHRFTPALQAALFPA